MSVRPVGVSLIDDDSRVLCGVACSGVQQHAKACTHDLNDHVTLHITGRNAGTEITE